MNRRVFAVLCLLAAGVWQLLSHYEIAGLDKISLKPRSGSSDWFSSWRRNQPLPAARASDTLRIASFNIQVFGESKLAKHEVMQILAQVVRHFDVVAIQEIRANTGDVLPQFLDYINVDGAHYDFEIGPRLGRTSSKEQYAYIFDASTVEIDRTSIYTINDPNDRLHREPLVAQFRARGVDPKEAFTFTLIDIHTDPDETDVELNALDDVYRAVRDDGHNEDDIILLGDLNVDDRHLGELGQVAFITWVISGTPTNTAGTHQYDNILFDRRATTEFTGGGGVVNLMSEFGLTMEGAQMVSDHCPIWAEFSTREGGLGGPLANRPQTTPQ